jgi:hypothetical protein
MLDMAAPVERLPRGAQTMLRHISPTRCIESAQPDLINQQHTHEGLICPKLSD